MTLALARGSPNLDDRDGYIDNNQVEPDSAWALERVFAGSLCSGKRVAAGK